MFKAVCVVVILVVSYTQQLHAQSIENKLLADVDAYCAYMADKNKAQRTVLNAPDVIVRVQNSNNDYLLQNNLVSGLSKDLSDLSKAKYLKELIVDECQYYRLTQEANIQIQFTIPRVQQKALDYKLRLISKAKNKVRRLLNTIQKRINSQNDTLHSYYQMDSLLLKLENEERDIRLKLALQQIPRMEFIPLKILLNQLWEAEKRRQITLNKLAKQNNWSLEVLAGGQEYSTRRNHQSVQPYVGLFARYNLGAITSNHHLDRSVGSYMDWKNKQINGIQRQLFALRKSVLQMRASEEERLYSLKNNYRKYYQISKKIKQIDSQKAIQFKQQMDIDRIMIDIEINYVRYFVDSLKNLV